MGFVRLVRCSLPAPGQLLVGAMQGEKADAEALPNVSGCYKPREVRLEDLP